MSKVEVISQEESLELNNTSKTPSLSEEILNGSYLLGVGTGQKINSFVLVIAALIQSMNVQQENESIQCKQLSSNAQAQEQLNNQQASFVLQVFTQGMEYQKVKMTNRHSELCTAPNDPAGVNKVWYTHKTMIIKHSSAMYNLNISNEKSECVRNCISNQILLLRQNAQIGESQLNSSVDQSQQTAQEGVSFMQMLVTIVNLMIQK